MRVTLCGSPQHEEAFHHYNRVLSLAGHVVYTVSVFPSQMVGKEHTRQQRAALKRVHLDKIDFSDAIFVIAPDGRLDDSTKQEIDHAMCLGMLMFTPHDVIDSPHPLIRTSNNDENPLEVFTHEASNKTFVKELEAGAAFSDARLAYERVSPVDNDYPVKRAAYERAVDALIEAMVLNGRKITYLR